MKELKIDPEFQGKIPPLTQAEFDQLRDNILADGEVYEPIVTWHGVIVDGHNRWRIVQEHPEIPYRVKEMDFADRWAAFEWMYKKQLGRRNLTDEQKTYMIGKMYEARKNTKGGDRGNQYTKVAKSQNETLAKSRVPRTDEIMGAEIGVNHATVARAYRFSQGIDALKRENPEAAEKVLHGKVNVTKKAISTLSNMNAEEVKAVAEQIEHGADLKHAHFPSGKKPSPKLVEMEPSINRDPSAVVEYGIEDLLEEMRAVNDDFLKKYRRMLSIHAELVSENAAEVATVFTELVTEFEKMEDF